MHDDDLISLLHEVRPRYLACRSTLFMALSHQHDTRIPEEEELLHRLRTKYTPVTCSIPRGDSPNTLDETDEPRELSSSYCLVGSSEVLHFFSRRSILARK